jgi:hypothetical protein
MRGSITIARAIATRWRSPPESWVGRCSMRAASPTASSAARTRSRRSRGSTPANMSGSSTLRAAVMRPTRWYAWNTKPILRWRTSASRSSLRFSTGSPSST